MVGRADVVEVEAIAWRDLVEANLDFGAVAASGISETLQPGTPECERSAFACH